MEDNKIERNAQSEVQKDIIIDQADLLETLRLEQNFPMAIFGGALGAIVGALLWAFFTVLTNFQIGYMAVAVGFIVGYLIRYFGKGLDNKFGFCGAFFALLGCLLGNYFSIVGFAANELKIDYFDGLSTLDFGAILSIMKENFGFIDIVFYGIAVYEGYRFSIRLITDEEVENHTKL